jgi:hypothetical protein
VRSPRRLAGFALLPAGTILGHASAYVLAGRAPDGGLHAYLNLAGWPVAFGALGALLWFSWSRHAHRSTPRVEPFAAAQVFFFLFQESLEGMIDGHAVTATLGSPTVRYGVAAQLVLAATIVLFTRLAAAGGARLRRMFTGRRSPCRPSGAGFHGRATAFRRPPALVASPASERGPPSLLVCL